VYGVFVEVGVSWAMPVNVFPCLDGVEVEFCRGDTNDGTVFVVEEFVFEGNSAFQEGADSRNGGNGVYFWAREF
jgi:hypothetical protein